MTYNLTTDFKQDIEAVSGIEEVNSILDVICKITGMGFAAVARVTKERWITCVVLDKISFGLKPGDELVIESTICYEIESSREPVIISYVDQDAKYAGHHTPKQYGFQSYISVPIILNDDYFFGTLCAIDPSPAELEKSEILSMFKLYANMIAFHLNTARKLSVTENSLKEEKETALLRDQFIAILGHDLRNPLGAIRNSAELLKRAPLDERGKKLTSIIIDSSFRINGLIENVLDFARGRLGDGITLNLDSPETLEAALAQVIAELNVISPEKEIVTDFSLHSEIRCDHKRIAQLFSNILGNAITYGKPGSPIIVKAVSNEIGLQLNVSNEGKQIPDAKLQKLFQPFHRGELSQNKDGLGLGLYIAAEIARAHNGTLTVKSTEEETCFSLYIPA